ncbi:MFS transporter [Ponticoccus sp. SC2-23]|uniref:MFS transporter n=1 Tax=Alexandriicola marinus TaxID=2081710 RepID=UPI000FD7958A|nr:MFS transporter [Alexandriicola marinus]MBM1218567.1 MFS transporter [Ponticoccus sp. SC6-9]MBM1224361.1 MFS transporter [Ponticoccus sp. SC6-15]MBM1233327.1 MFS transporter [Ponticoccus sp. SC6-45]MBM1236723.1 MFS transporter [Ponticoccus sp. SC6-49]MBM1242338.1 MFS transporter [Ponticoccus sp. SC2-64]MBM1246851.1 MFS transporter [Ponticoccus sp. SC6-42]MBM1251329.1 MFS transporter [Ponticoccus sp. SC6-33]MBM1254732.1 MFS transporter [Ponticoccus sp. SC6-60]MBM1259238.1 MFS transporter
MLAVLFGARASMAFQFQSIGALSPVIGESYAVELADIGLLIGLYLAPGIIVAGPGSALATRVGEVRFVSGALFAMFAGGIMVLVLPQWSAALAGRTLAGAGGVIVNVILTKFIVDWFAGKGLSTAMAVFITSWPLGIALASMVLPPVAETAGLGAAQLVVIVVIVVSTAAFLLFYRPPPVASAGAPKPKAAGDAPRERLSWMPITLAGLIWALYTAGLAMVFSFAPAWLTDEGWTLSAAGALTGGLMALYALMLPVGGILADRTGARDLIIAVSFVGFAALMPLALFAGQSVIVVPLFLAIGMVFSLAAGPIMTLPNSVLTPATLTIGMGWFWTIYYVVMVIFPRVGGALGDRTGNSAAALWLGVGLIVAAGVSLVAFRYVAARRRIVA